VHCVCVYYVLSNVILFTIEPQVSHVTRALSSTPLARFVEE